MDAYSYSSAEAGPSRSTSVSTFSDRDNQAIFEDFEAYPFSDDPDFKAGLPTVIAAIRGTKRSATQIDEMIGRAQWFYFTRLKNINIPWETYAASQTAQQLAPTRSSSSSSSGSNALTKTDPLAVLNNLAEARRMMSTGSDPDSGEFRMSFAMLTSLISEGRAGEVPVRQIPEGLNDTVPSESTLASRPKPWELPPFDSSSPPFQPRSYSQPSLQYPYPNLSASSFASTSSASFANSPHMGPPSYYTSSPPLLGILNNPYTGSPPLMGMTSNPYTTSPPLMGMSLNQYMIPAPPIGDPHVMSSNDFFAPLPTHGFTSSPHGSPTWGHSSLGPSPRGSGPHSVEGEKPGSSRSM